MKQVKIFHGLGPFLLLWSTQALSSLGSAMTSFGLVIWSYQQHGSAADHRAFVGVYLCAVCAAEHFCRRDQRSVG